MCLLTIAHRASTRFPLVIAANRDEDYDRATHDAHFWNDAPDVLGGRDAVAGGSWLAVTRTGRFAAVTNLRGAERQTRSRGALVRDFVVGEMTPADYPMRFMPYADQYAGFHFFAGEAGGELLYATPHSSAIVEPGIHAVSNAPDGEVWPKVGLAANEMQVALKMDDAESMMLVLMQFLALERGTGAVESEVFIKGDRYGTRASTVIVVTESEILFGEQSFTRGGVPYSRNRLFRIER
jgi:uncharacterized protein with NRDE domain